MPFLTQKSQVTIPQKIRALLGIRPGDEINFEQQGRRVFVRKKTKLVVIDKYRGFLGKGRTAAVMEQLR